VQQIVASLDDLLKEASEVTKKCKLISLTFLYSIVSRRLVEDAFDGTKQE